MTRYNLPDKGSQEWYASPLNPAVADLDQRIADGTATATGLAAQVAALQTAVATAQAAANAAQATANAANAVKPYWTGYLAATTSVPALSDYLVSWTVDATSGGFFYSAGVLTLPALTGRYRVNASLFWDKSSNVGGRLSQVYSGSTGGSLLIIGGTSGNTTGTTGDHRQGSTAAAIKTLSLAAGTQIRVLANQGGDGSLGVIGGPRYTYWQVEYVGPN